MGEHRMQQLPDWAVSALRCPRCRGGLQVETRISCGECGASYAVVGGVPVLLDPEASVVSFSNPEIAADQRGGVQRLLLAAEGILPSLSRSYGSRQNYEQLVELLDRMSRERARILVVGGRILGAGMRPLLDSRAELVETDIAFGPRTMVVCDAQRLPFADDTFEGVVIQAVLAAVPDPEQAVGEIHRVLVTDGLVYAEDSFMQQVWGGSMDFHRWTAQGHRRLFRAFEEIDRGMVDGPGTALAWSWRSFLLSFVSSTGARLFLGTVARLTAFWLKYLDGILAKRPAALDAASGLFFLGRKSSRVMSDDEIISGYHRGVGA
jgi:SAM-dependent methyltransferase/uncharacterized protein YbaR (Trm112 family)